MCNKKKNPVAREVFEYYKTRFHLYLAVYSMMNAKYINTYGILSLN